MHALTAAPRSQLSRWPPQIALLGTLALGACSSCEPTNDSVVAPTPTEVFGTIVPPRVPALFETDRGTITCAIEAARAPRAAALVVGLARGAVRWRDPRTGQVTTRPFYDGLTFHRRIAGVLIQTGCPLGDGTGTPGYRIPVEHDPTDRQRLSRPGALVLATYTPPPFRVDPAPPPPGHVIGSQLAITLAPMPHLLDRVTVLGTCSNLPTTLPTHLLHLGTGSR